MAHLLDADLGHVRGHRQVTDAYLAALALQRGSLLATLDSGLAGDLPDATLLVPPQPRLRGGHRRRAYADGSDG